MLRVKLYIVYFAFYYTILQNLKTDKSDWRQNIDWCDNPYIKKKIFVLRLLLAPYGIYKCKLVGLSLPNWFQWPLVINRDFKNAFDPSQKFYFKNNMGPSDERAPGLRACTTCHEFDFKSKPLRQNTIYNLRSVKQVRPGSPSAPSGLKLILWKGDFL